jgi:signal transduction histidine kinase
MMDEALRASPLFASLSARTLAGLAHRAEAVTLEPGEVLFAQGEEPAGLYLVAEGELEVVRRRGSTELQVATSHRGDLVGELALAHGGPRTATVRAVTPARLLLLDTDAFADLLTDRDAAMSLLGMVTRRLGELELELRRHDRMALLGTLAAGLLHELNNPAAAVTRSVDRLAEMTVAWQDLDADLEDRALLGALGGLLDRARPPPSALQRLETETEIERTLAALGVVADETDLTSPLAGLGIAPPDLASVLAGVPPSDAARALRWLALRGQVARLVEETRTGAARISEIVGAVKGYVHVGETGSRDVDVHEGIEAALTLLRGRIPSGVRIVRAYDPDLGTVPGFPADLSSVWMNLLDNALDAVGERGTITIRTEPLPAAIRVEVANTGPAVPPAILDRVFDPFFTTKAVGEGTGLGLATTYSVVTGRHQGTVELTSVEDDTVATVTLPRRWSSLDHRRRDAS